MKRADDGNHLLLVQEQEPGPYAITTVLQCYDLLELIFEFSSVVLKNQWYRVCKDWLMVVRRMWHHAHEYTTIEYSDSPSGREFRQLFRRSRLAHGLQITSKRDMHDHRYILQYHGFGQEFDRHRVVLQDGSYYISMRIYWDDLEFQADLWIADSHPSGPEQDTLQRVVYAFDSKSLYYTTIQLDVGFGVHVILSYYGQDHISIQQIQLGPDEHLLPTWNADKLVSYLGCGAGMYSGKSVTGVTSRIYVAWDKNGFPCCVLASSSLTYNRTGLLLFMTEPQWPLACNMLYYSTTDTHYVSTCSIVRGSVKRHITVQAQLHDGGVGKIIDDFVLAISEPERLPAFMAGIWGQDHVLKNIRVPDKPYRPDTSPLMFSRAQMSLPTLLQQMTPSKPYRLIPHYLTQQYDLQTPLFSK